MAALAPNAAAWLDAADSLDIAPRRNVEDGGKAKLRSGMQKTLTQTASDPAAFRKLMSTAFGDSYDASKAEAIRQQTLRGDMSWLPKIEFVEDSALPSGAGAYDKKSGTVYLSKSLKDRPDAALEVFSEEVGHHLDAKLNTSDTPGDEGEIFRRTLSGEKLSAKELAKIRAEDDRGVVRINGREVEVEYFFGKVFKKIGGAIKKGVKKVGGALKKVGGAIKKGAKKVGGFVKKVGKGLQKGLGVVSKIMAPFKKILDALGPALAFIPGIGQILTGVRTGLGMLSAAAKGKWKQLLTSVAGAFGGPVAKWVERGLGYLSAAKGFVQNVKRGGLSGALGAVSSVAGRLAGPGRFGQTMGRIGTWADRAQTGLGVLNRVTG